MSQATDHLKNKPFVMHVADDDKVPLGTTLNVVFHEASSSLLVQVKVSDAWKRAFLGDTEGGWVS